MRQPSCPGQTERLQSVPDDHGSRHILVTEVQMCGEKSTKLPLPGGGGNHTAIPTYFTALWHLNVQLNSAILQASRSKVPLGLLIPGCHSESPQRQMLDQGYKYFK